MAAKLGVSRNYVSMIEGGKMPSESLQKLFTIMESSPLYSSSAAREEAPVFAIAGSSPRAKLRAARLSAGLDIKALAKKAGVQIGVLQAVEEGNARLPEKVAERIVRFLPDVTLEELLGGSDTPRIFEETGASATMGAKARGPLAADGGRVVPLLSMAACGTLSDVAFVDDAYDGEGVETTVKDRQAFGVKLSGDSMSPEMNAGDRAIVSPNSRPSLGSPVIVRTINGDVLCKYYQTKDGGRIVILSSVNKSYEPIEIPVSEIAWIYPIKQLIKNY